MFYKDASGHGVSLCDKTLTGNSLIAFLNWIYRERTEHQRFTAKLDDILCIASRDVYIFKVLFIFPWLTIKIMSNNSGVLDLLWWAVTWLFYNVVSKVSTLVYDIVIEFISAVACLHNLLQPPVKTVPRNSF